MVGGTAAGRKAKRGQRWCPRGAKMKVATNVRDLGAHLNVHAATRCGAAAERIERALCAIKRLAVQPIDSEKKLLALK
eukprot:4357438-Alexandrium_andersonii.AAC.1